MEITDSKTFLGQTVRVKIDRPFGSKHPRFGYVYPVNYGYISNTISADGGGLDAYVLGVSEPLEEFEGECIAVIHRIDDNDDKLIVVSKGKKISDEEINEQIYFQEQYFQSKIIRK